MDSIEKERAYLEELLNRRFHYFLVIAPAILAAAFISPHIDDFGRRMLFGAGALISLVWLLILYRTASLLQVLLEILTGHREGNGKKKLDVSQPGAPEKGDPPYRIASHWVRTDRPRFLIKPKWNANDLMLFFALAAATGFTALAVCTRPNDDEPAPVEKPDLRGAETASNIST